MTKEDIIRMAQEAGLIGHTPKPWSHRESVERFADLVASFEREACAKVCEKLSVYPELNVYNGGPDWYKHGKACAKAIRARGQA